mmetsp:Transcript_60746/g.190928  ORF Transcript_60746/g.190928 Transcript_60746/m.190928 type:complete len:246 (-) Transcript_60746:57-794(-)
MRRSLRRRCQAALQPELCCWTSCRARRRLQRRCRSRGRRALRFCSCCMAALPPQSPPPPQAEAEAAAAAVPVAAATAVPEEVAVPEAVVAAAMRSSGRAGARGTSGAPTGRSGGRTGRTDGRGPRETRGSAAAVRQPSRGRRPRARPRRVPVEAPLWRSPAWTSGRRLRRPASPCPAAPRRAARADVEATLGRGARVDAEVERRHPAFGSAAVCPHPVAIDQASTCLPLPATASLAVEVSAVEGR